MLLRRRTNDATLRVCRNKDVERHWIETMSPTIIATMDIPAKDAAHNRISNEKNLDMR